MRNRDYLSFESVTWYTHTLCSLIYLSHAESAFIKYIIDFLYLKACDYCYYTIISCNDS